jgi:N-methylhydantoinase B
MPGQRGHTERLSLRVFHHQLVSVAEEMGEALMRSAFSPNIKERRDFSCAVFDATGRLLAQAAHIPVHLGAMPLAVRAARAAVEGSASSHLASPRAAHDQGRPAQGRGWARGDVVALNDPYAGGTHLPDLTMVSPVFSAGRRPRLLGFVASRAHQADIGGMSPGSMPLSTELFQEGLIIPPIKLVERGEWRGAALALLLRNVRTPDERLGDLEAQVAAHRTGERRLRELAQRYPPATLRRRIEAVLDHTEALVRHAIARIPRGTYRFVDWLDDDGLGSGPLRIEVAVTATGDGEVVVDFSGTAAETLGPVNAVAAVTCSAVYYCIRCLAPEDLPSNEGALRPIRIIAPEGTLVNARPPRAVCAGNVETSQRIVDAVFGALAQALPDVVPAASQGTMNNLTLGGLDPARGRPFAYYETIGGGAGAGPAGPGLSGIHVHMSNTLNTPVEALELAYPVRVVEYRLRRGSGGPGRYGGGDGLRRVIQALAPCTATLITERRSFPPWGLAGGGAGAPGRNWLRRAGARRPPSPSGTPGSAPDPEPLEETLPGKVELRLEAGDVLGIETPGGGGWGAPPTPGTAERSPRPAGA